MCFLRLLLPDKASLPSTRVNLSKKSKNQRNRQPPSVKPSSPFLSTPPGFQHAPPRSLKFDQGGNTSMAPNTRKGPRSPPLPIVWENLTDKNVKQLQRLNSTIFPVKYNQLFYSEAIKAPEGFVKLAYYNETLVGAVCCRKEKYAANKAAGKVLVQPSASHAGGSSSMSSLYIMTLGVLAPYRERGIGKQLITHVLDLVRSSPDCSDVVDIYLHVQDGNDEALRFYEGYGFEVKEKLLDYYKRIDPADCYIVRKAVDSK